ncbi:MAG: polysaccharide export protein [Acetobacteraceae bacterium]|nr:polysaccharide export protein [Acetobacteraceae bacterium]
MISRRWLVFLPAPVALQACAQRPLDPLSRVPAAAATEEYRLGAGDRIRVVVFNEEQLSGEVTVDPNGVVSLPLVGNVRVDGRSATQAATEIAQRLRGPFLRDPNVSVQVVQTRPFYVLGEVQRPGEYPYRPGLSIAAAVAIAGGYTFRANQTRIFLTRQGAPTEFHLAVTPELVIAPGDVVRVPERIF